MSQGAKREDAADFIAAKMEFTKSDEDFRESVESFAISTLSTRSFDVTGFCRLMSGMDMGFEELYKRYVGKNVLNFFRQDNGYQDGSYIKIWGGREDNEHLVDVVDALDGADPLFKDKVYTSLAERYQVAR